MIAHQDKKTSSGPWNYKPDVPIKTSPLFHRPVNISKIIRWYVGGWYPLTVNQLVLGLSLLSWWFFHPMLETCKEIHYAWVSQIFIRNLALIFLVAGGLHLYFYVLKIQQNERHYDARPLRTKARVFALSNQVFDNIFWTCVSGVTIWTGLEVIMMWALANGFAPVLVWPRHWGWIVLLIFLIPVWETFYFYLIHRILHWPWLYKRVHYLHHRNTNIGPWSGLSMHPIEHILFLGSVLIHWVIPSNPLVIIFHLQYFTLTAATTHTGYEGITRKNKLILPLGTFHHQLHHRYFECNYGGLEIPWDKWMHSFHDGTDKSHQDFLDRQKALRQATS